MTKLLLVLLLLLLLLLDEFTNAEPFRTRNTHKLATSTISEEKWPQKENLFIDLTWSVIYPGEIIDDVRK